jgi:hypothetical protein
MIKHQTIDGRPASLAYLHEDFSPADANTFYFIKINFDDGSGSVFLVNENGAGDADSGGEASAFNRHRGRRMVPPIAESEGAAESAAFGRHRYRHRAPITEPQVELAAPEPGEKHQLVAWAKAIIVLDKSEILVRDLIERDLAGAHVMPIARILVITERLTRKISVIRESAIKLAFRLLRDRLGDRPVLDHSLAVWAKTFAAKDAESIKQAIVSGLSDGLDSTEIARKVVGSMALNGVDGVTEATRLHVAHLGRAAIKASRQRKTAP